MILQKNISFNDHYFMAPLYSLIIGLICNWSKIQKLHFYFSLNDNNCYLCNQQVFSDEKIMIIIICNWIRCDFNCSIFINFFIVLFSQLTHDVAEFIKNVFKWMNKNVRKKELLNPMKISNWYKNLPEFDLQKRIILNCEKYIFIYLIL